ncbi:hypothetical protein Mtc_1371 [Methanocella conradii HZ254]|uniref:Uncharacterized protein n=1 Tax=Methanocella conradii (strain DSM 24694 / JCM 17849 / CGMCC 1.5162 / HZ254) TaxID=1041930 RepID=H8IAM8_METCZ|nr:hypothetical protein [Methanocella conradii]AFD00125.1 hypothetical protein Mtc_1371 [Methanocella conradii HZ254]MDI6896055.1 hypothetical protein [Methanocella conradii]
MRISIAILTFAAAISLFISGAGASLAPASFGFPTIVQMANSVAWSQDTANALRYEDVSIDFGGGVPFGPVSLAFPSIHQTSLECQSMTHTDFAQTSEYAAFAYPFVGVGSYGLPVPGLA